MCRLGATMSVLRERPVETSDVASEKKVAEVLVRWVPENQQVDGIFSRFCSIIIPQTSRRCKIT